MACPLQKLRLSPARSAAALVLFVSHLAAAQVHKSTEARVELAPPSDKPHAGSVWRKVRGPLRGTGAARARKDGPLRAIEPARTQTGRLRVTVRLRAGAPDRAALASAGLAVERAPHGSTLIQGSVDPIDLPRVAGLPGVAWVGPLDVPIHRVGSITTEGDAGSRADVARQQGLDGSGVTVGVISDGIDGLAAAQASGDLGAVTVPPDSRCRRGSGDEGTALLEIVHDVAPGARLLFSGPGSSVDMIDSVRCLAAAGADVIVDDLSFLLEPYFEDGPVAEAVRSAVSLGVSYHAAAGNSADEFLETDFRPSPSTMLHDFNATVGGAVDNFDSLLVPPRAQVLCVLQWSDPFGASGNDYDLFMLDASLTIVSTGGDVQDGDDDPLEVTGVVNPTSIPQLANVAIQRVAGETRRFKLFCFDGVGAEYVTPEGSVFGHQALPEVVAVGAVDQAEPGRDQVQGFSSRGPVRILFPAAALRPKPDLVALDGVGISNAGGFPACPPSCRFFGTSAAAPHAAGVTALMLQRSAGLSPAAVLAALQAGARDIEAPGRDSLAGAGLLDAVASLALLAPATTSTLTPTTTSSSTSTTVANASCAGRCPDDGDECTAEACEQGVGCRSTTIGRAEGVVCLVDRLLGARSCRPDEISPRVRALIGRKALKAKAHAARSVGASPRRYALHVRRTLGLLRRLTRKIDAAITAGRLRGTCQTRVSAALARTLSLAENTTF